ncbi:unnamed protein product [Hermetia illucens]|uniref:Uncharacterized protein n=2 Tax=Hermetia illucens TaxID=343691 RepID=A0A7R8UTM3_HERIL|nr:unnamed protein product [Hermetia illucens]
MDGEITLSSSYQSPAQTIPSSNQNGRRRRRPGGRKRRRRPQGTYQTTESSNEFNNFYWEGQVQDENVNDSVILSFYNTTDYYSSTMSSSEEQETRRRFLQPQVRVERVREPLAALEQEQKLSELRDKQRKRASTESPITAAYLYRDKSYRKPYAQAKRQDDTTSQTPPRSGTDLKDILKNSGGLSLSEILQQKNLSLDDLIKGKQNALLALQTPAAPTEEPTTKYLKPIRRIPMSYLTSTTTTTSTEAPPSSESQEHETELSTSANVPSTQETNNNISSENLIYNNEFSTKDDLDNYPASSQEPPRSVDTTHKTTPFAAEDILQTAQQKADFIEDEAHDTQPWFNTLPTRSTYRKRVTIKPSYKVSSSKKPVRDSSSSSESSSSEKHYEIPYHDKNSSSQESIEDKLSQKEPETNFIEKFATFEEAKPKDVSTIEELFRPLYHKKDNSNLFETITSRVDIITEKHFNKAKSDVTESNPSLFTNMGVTQDVDDRTDLLELLEDRRSGGRLFKVLAQRNMTLDELIQHRQRGSSQLHLAEMIQNKTVTPNVKSFSIKPQVLDEKLDIVTAFDNFPQFDLANLKSIKPDEIKMDSQGSSYFTSIIDIKPTDDMGREKEGRIMKSLSFDSAEPTTFLASGEDKSIDFYAQPWKSFALPISYSSQESSNYIDQPNEPSAQIGQPDETADKFDTAAQIEDEVARAHDILDLELSGHGLRRSPIVTNGEIPMGVRSAVVASSLIVVFSLVIFLIIFIVCRWKQKRRKKLTYIDNYNAIKQKRLPIISTQSTMKRIDPATMTVATVSGASPMIFPGVKNNKINTMDPNSPEVQEYLFDAMRKPF